MGILGTIAAAAPYVMQGLQIAAPFLHQWLGSTTTGSGGQTGGSHVTGGGTQTGTTSSQMQSTMNQRGLSRMWTRKGRFDFYHPMLANLSEMAVLNQEIYAQGTSQDTEVFGYQEAWADYRYHPNIVTGEMRSNYAQSLDAWHYADHYEALPMLSSTWIQEGTENIDRTLAVQAETSHQFIADFYFDQTWTRPMPIYSVPGLETI